MKFSANIYGKAIAWLAIVGILCSSPDNVKAQFSTILYEDFEGCVVATLPIGCGGQTWNTSGLGSPWNATNGVCTIDGTYSLAVGSDANICEYNLEFGTTNRMAYTQISTAGFQLMTVKFKWKAGGETGIDFGRVMYSNDGVTWTDVAGFQFQGQIGGQSYASPIPAAFDDDPTAFIGFEWNDDGNGVGGFPGFVVDSLEISGEVMIPPNPGTPVTAAPLACDSVMISWGGLPPTPSNVVWYWQDTLCGTDTTLGSDTNYAAYTTDTYYIRAYNSVSGLWSVNCDSISVTVEGPSPTVDAGPGATLCSQTYGFSATTTGGVTSWTVVSGPGAAVFNDSVSANDTVTVSEFGTYIFMWSAANGNCVDSDTVAVTFVQTPVANGGAGGVVCSNIFTLSAIPSAGTGIWTLVSGPGPVPILPTTSSGINIPVTIFGTYVYQWKETNGICSDSVTVSVSYADQPVADAGVGSLQCDLDYNLIANPSVGTGVWSQLFGAGTSTFADSSSFNTVVTVSQSGTYGFQWSENNAGCIDDDDVTVTFSVLTGVTAGIDTSVSLGNSIYLDGFGAGTYLWTPDTFLSDNTLPDPYVSPLETTTYTLTVTDINGCTMSDTVVVNVLIDYNFVVSNIMTPNGDGKNDTWYIDNIDFYSECEVSIFNRYGFLLYNQTGYGNDWNAEYNNTALPDGTYYYVITCPGSQDIFKGGITILRQ